MNTPRMTNQSDHSVPQFLHFILMIPLIFLNIFLIFYAALRFLPQGLGQDDIKRPPAENDRRPAPALGRILEIPETSGLN